jgi:hypothetical protein
LLPPRLEQLVGGHDLRTLLAEWLGQGAGEVEHIGGGGNGRIREQPDRAEAEALGLQVLDHLQARDVLGAVIAGPAADLGRGSSPRDW